MLIRVRVVEGAPRENATDWHNAQEGLLDIRGPHLFTLASLIKEAAIVGSQASIMDMLSKDARTIITRNRAFTKPLFSQALLPARPWQYWRHEVKTKKGMKIQVMITRLSIPRLVSTSWAGSQG